MLRERISPNSISKFLRYLASHKQAESEGLPSLTDLSSELGISVAALREQLQVARALGLVEVRPRKGTRRLPYTFTPAVRQSLGYALALDDEHFQSYSDLRAHLESAYFYEAVKKLTGADHQAMKALLTQAWEKLRGNPIQIPHDEHRELHLLIYRRLDNIFVTGLLEAYWEAYEAIGLNVFTDYEYLTKVWQYHTDMVEAIYDGNYEAGYQALMEHTDLIYHRPVS
ncbi:MAG: FadR family transcriptional regulator [Chloroflexi bacterium]|nr:FadR family transcriptional regulator [Chloroflexota bacterium]